MKQFKDLVAVFSKKHAYNQLQGVSNSETVYLPASEFRNILKTIGITLSLNVSF